MACSPEKKSKLRSPIVAVGLVLLVILLCAASFTRAAYRPPANNVNDFVEYWAAGRLAVQGDNPYEADRLLDLERQTGFHRSNALVMLNPPWTIPLVAPFALLPFAFAQNSWLALGLVSILVSGRWLWGIYRVEGQSPWTAWLSAALFLPVAVVLAIGQITPIVLLGIAGFMHFERQKKLILCGMFLFLAAQKPHLIFLFWIALLLWSVRTHLWKPLAALTSVTLAASLIAVTLDHRIFVQYSQLLMNRGAFTEIYPTVSGFLRSSFGGHYPLQLLPAFLAFVWLFFHWKTSRDRWQWSDEMPLLLLISMLTTSYGWFFDQVILLPCILQATAWGAKVRGLRSIAIAAIYLATNAVVLTLILMHRTTFSYVWTVPAWSLLYVFVRIQYSSQSTATKAA